uniref:Sulfotransferase n=1 Tax=Amphilophus citrinellus TaxID=61819 RepID=A0A3Q0QUJ4_AMPCI
MFVFSLLFFSSKVVLPSRPELFDFPGVSMTHIFTNNWENVQNFQARTDDILIAIYPKAGTTWVSQIFDLLYFGQTSPERQKTIPIYEYHYWRFVLLTTSALLHTGKDLADKLPTSPRLIKTHFPQNCRMVYVACNTKENIVFYIHIKRMNRVETEPGAHTSIDSWKEKVYSTSSYSLQIIEKMINKYAQTLYIYLCICNTDTEQEIDKLSCFLGLTPSAEEKKMIAGGVQFDNMKNNEMANQSTCPIFDFKISPFMRKGMVNNFNSIQFYLYSAKSQQKVASRHFVLWVTQQ